MTYGMDFRPGARSLPRHDTATLPPVAEYAEFLAAHPSTARNHNEITAEKFRRVFLMCEHGSWLHDACRQLGIQYPTVRNRLRTMPARLVGPVLAKRFHVGEAA